MIISFVCLGAYFLIPDAGFGHYVVDKHHITDTSPEQWDSVTRKAMADKFLEIYNNRREHYSESSHALSTITTGWAFAA